MDGGKTDMKAFIAELIVAAKFLFIASLIACTITVAFRILTHFIWGW